MTKRIIPRLEIKSRKLIKGIRMEGLRVVGDPVEKIIKYYNDGADEIIYDDIVASLYDRKYDINFINELSKNIFIPFCVGGGIKNINDIHDMLDAGADKVAINTHSILNENLIYQASRIFGSQCIVLEIQAKKLREGYWEAYTESGRERHKLDAIEWAKKAESLGVGEILLIAIDNDGMKKGPDLELIKSIKSSVSVPLIAGGGVGDNNHINDIFKIGNADAVCLSNCLHFNSLKISDIKLNLKNKSENIRLN